MKLGISYNVFEGEELLPFLLPVIRKEIDFIAVVYQTVSFFGNSVHEELLPNLQNLKSQGLIDELVEAKPDLSTTARNNETRMRNIGIEKSQEAGCTHHISSDVDEFYLPEQLAFAKTQMDGYDCSVISNENYYKKPTWRMYPRQKHLFPFIQKISSRCDVDVKFPYRVDVTRKCNPCNRCRFFDMNEVTMHHMTFVRKDISRKVYNSQNNAYYKVEKFLKDFDKYNLGDRLQVVPDFINRRTILVENIFNIEV